MGEIVRLQKYIAMCGTASRRAAEKLIEEGKVKVNGKKVTELGTKVEIGADKVLVNGKLQHPEQKKYYIALNKPSGYVTTAKDELDRPTVLDIISQDIDARLFPVGRLDFETEGLLILTNDGDFANRVSHPKYEKDKTYVVTIKGGIPVASINKLRRGVVIDGYRTSPAQLEMLDAVAGKTTFKITIHEGRNRQVRKMFESVGGKVVYLQRIKIGNVELGNLPLGRWRHLTSHEISFLSGNLKGV